MMPRWKQLEAIHAFLGQATVHSTDPESWHQVLLETLSASSAGSTVTCIVSPSTCQHCHQLMALSAVTTISLLLKEKEDRQMERVYLQPLLQPAALKCMVDLLLHSCAFLRYHVRRTLTTLLTLDNLPEAAVQYVTEACIKIVQQHSTEPPLCLEPLQLLCSMLSRRSGRSLNVQTSGFLFPHLPSLYQCCCKALENHSAEITSRSISAQKRADHPLWLEREETDCCSLVRTGGHASASMKEKHTEYSAESSCKRAQTELSVHQEPVLGSLGTLKSLANICSESKEFENLHYMFLCLVQKITKFVNSLNVPERTSQQQFLNNNILTRLVDDHVPSFSKDFTEPDSAQLCRERKFLDVLDTLLNCTSVRTKDLAGSAHEKLAAYFIHCFHASGCSWSFPSQRTFIGGGADKGGGLMSGCHHGHELGSEAEGGGMPGWSGDDNRSPVLVLLLLVVLKSCAIVFKTAGEQDGERVSRCTAVLHTMHCHLGKLLAGGGSAAGSVSESPAHLDWLPQVCGEQDDRWMEALLCLLEIFIHAQFISCVDSDDLKMLTTLLDPHRLFVQLLHLTHYDSSLLLDWLTSPETCFLAYITRYLRLVAADFSAFSRSAQAWSLAASSPSSPAGGEGVEREEEEILQHGMVCTPRQSNGISTGSEFSRSVVDEHVKLLQCGERSELHSHAELLSHLSQAEVMNSDSGSELKGNEPEVMESESEMKDSESEVDSESEMKDSESEVKDNEPETMDSESEVKDCESEVKDKKSGSTDMCCRSGERQKSNLNPKCTADSDITAKTSVGLALLSFYGSDGDDSTGDDDDDDDDVDDNAADAEACEDEGNSIHLDDMASEGNSYGCHAYSGNSVALAFNENECSENDSRENVSPNRRERPLSHKPRSGQADTWRLATMEKTGASPSWNCVGRVMHLLLALRQRLERLHSSGLLVYNPAPLLSLMRQCEQQYQSPGGWGL